MSLNLGWKSLISGHIKVSEVSSGTIFLYNNTCQDFRGNIFRLNKKGILYSYVQNIEGIMKKMCSPKSVDK